MFPEPNYPNPFSSETRITYRNPETGPVSLKVFDASGKEISVLVNQKKSAGLYEISFNAADLDDGVYFYQIKTAGFTETRKMILQK
ncbi:T9SS type A sorting domain-containing protein [Saccharicrinis sp. FJH62]|uniref:T9SS type A sorting domain-containing protein n=1 Tax=Saccharicrinis sp. FJH62 TaxID=3344657 RepID=UPI0035D49D10